MLKGGDEETGSAAGGVENGFAFKRIGYINHKVNNVARSAELTCIPLTAEDGEEILKSIAEALGIVIVKSVDGFKETAEGFGILIGEISIFENVPEERGNVGIDVHFLNCLGIEIKHLETTELRRHKVLPGERGIVAGKEFSFTSGFLHLAIHIVHKFIDHSAGNLFKCACGIRDFATRCPCGVYS
jgi:hypothetical protein